MQNKATVIIIENEIVNGSKLNNLNTLVKSGEPMPLRLNGGIEYIIESENSKEIKNFWDTLDKSMKISCINSAINDRTKSLEDLIYELIKI
ncbi:hypothetical protein K8R14_02165 [bacterium]|nr:hypothetical protein [bacterium]